MNGNDFYLLARKIISKYEVYHKGKLTWPSVLELEEFIRDFVKTKEKEKQIEDA